MNSDGTGLVELPLPKTDRVQDWSPDGEYLLVDSTARGIGSPKHKRHHALTYRPDGKQPRHLTSGRSYGELKYSPDGRRIAYRGATGDDDPISGLGLMNADGSDHRQITYPVDQGRDQICWSPDGRRLATRAHEKVQVDLSEGGSATTIGRVWIEIIDTDGSGRHQIDLPAGFQPGCPAWY